ncbi:MAG TPA: beta-ketoacyl synthase chain length factor [Steroidobacteraceae bacterium]|nr:beta-ketoacyl synthase chain length factor [Steroidobacteraceae bacterium]
MSTPLTAWVEGVGILGPGLTGWSNAAAVLAGRVPYAPGATSIPPLECLPPAERRRTGKVVRLALTVGLEATAHAGAERSALPAVFSSSGGDGENCHEICQVLASADRQISPTRFHNSVHNASSGYWGIATGATAASNALCAHDGSFVAGLLEALVQARIDETAVLLIAYDSDYPQPIRSARPIPDAFAVALLLTPGARQQSLARLTAQLCAAPAERLPDAQLEALRAQIPAARSLPLLRRLARPQAGATMIEYQQSQSLRVEVSPCH